jgi:hypothetical protein
VTEGLVGVVELRLNCRGMRVLKVADAHFRAPPDMETDAAPYGSGLRVAIRYVYSEKLDLSGRDIPTKD